MKNVTLLAALMTFVLVSCNQKNKETEIQSKEPTEKTTELYSCPMHPDVKGKKGESCSKCGMELTEPVKE